jgi:hypothetical protein
MIIYVFDYSKIENFREVIYVNGYNLDLNLVHLLAFMSKTNNIQILTSSNLLLEEHFSFINKMDIRTAT